jgi:hypothetical protein
MTGASLGGPPADRTSVPDAVRRATPGVHFNHVAVTYPRAATPRSLV